MATHAQTIDSIKIESNNKTFVEPVQSDAEYPGGSSALLVYLSKNMRYPAQAITKHLQGKVIVTFVVEKDGKINDIKVARPLWPLIDSEAIRLVSQMPKWKPATQNNAPIRVRWTLPINFTLPEKK